MTDILSGTLWAMNRILNPDRPVLATCDCGHEYKEVPEDMTVTDEGTVWPCEVCGDVVRLEEKRGA